MSNEIKVALLAIAALGLSYWGYKFVLGKNVLKNSNLYYVEFNNVDMMQTSSPVTISGVQVGFVAEIQPLIAKQKVLVSLDLQKDLKIPKNTMAIIQATGFMGGKAVVLEYDQPCSGSDCAQSGDYLQGVTRGLLTSMLSQDEVNEYLNILKENIGTIVDTLNQHLLGEHADGPIANSLRSLEATMGNLESSTGQLDGILYRSSDNITGTLDNLERITANLDSRNEKIGNIIDQTSSFSDQLAQLELTQTLNTLNATIAQLKSTLYQADQAFVGINTLVGDLESGQGTLGRLLQDETLYQELTTLSTQADSLIEDIQDRPYRYVPLKNRKKVLRYDRKDEHNN